MLQFNNLIMEKIVHLKILTILHYGSAFKINYFKNGKKFSAFSYFQCFLKLASKQSIKHWANFSTYSILIMKSASAQENSMYQNLITFFFFIFSVQFSIDWLLLPKENLIDLKSKTDSWARITFFSDRWLPGFYWRQ